MYVFKLVSRRIKI